MKKKTHPLKKQTLIQDLAPGDTFQLYSGSDDFIKLDEMEPGPQMTRRFLCANLLQGRIYRVSVDAAVFPVSLEYYEV